MAHIAHDLFKHCQSEKQIHPLAPLYTHGAIFFESQHHCSYSCGQYPDIQVNAHFYLDDSKLFLVNYLLIDQNA
jgi:hypothetical protein